MFNISTAGLVKNAPTDKYSQCFHIAPKDGFMNDIQTAFYRNGVWHVYFLYNKDFSTGGNGTEWYHATTTDWMKFDHHGVAIEKYKDKWGDIATGCIFEDKENRLGYGNGAIAAYVTRYGEMQTTHLFISTDDGYTFKSYEGNPIQHNPGNNADFRDPFVFVQDNTFYLYLAEHEKFGIYKSADGKNFSYVTGINIEDHGLVECPTLLEMKVYGKDETKWVFCFGSNNWALSTGMHYQVGRLENGVFLSDTEIRRLDYGPDFYAGKMFYLEEGNKEAVMAVAWMGNWEYSKEVPHCGVVGCMSLPRVLTLDESGRLINNFYPSYKDYLTPTITGYNFPLTGPLKKLPITKGEKFFLRLVFTPNGETFNSAFGVVLKGDNYQVKIHHQKYQNEIFIERSCNDFPDNTTFNTKRIVQHYAQFKETELLIAVDHTSMEVIYGDGAAISLLKFGNIGKEEIYLYCDEGGSASFEYYDLAI